MPSLVSLQNQPQEEPTKNTRNRRASLLTKPLETLTNIDEIRDALRMLDEEETRVDASLDTILAEEHTLNTSLSILSNVRTQLDTLTAESSPVIETVQKTSRLAEVISFKVRQLEQEQSRVKEAIHYVEDVQDLKYCIANLQAAIQKKDYDLSAELLNKALKIDGSIVNGSLAEFTVVKKVGWGRY
ncbi:hypothetical protein BDB01DRAFT_715420 [Pilobolus umbonatus]|nr:hypothetical protein BDB01DRAFT_715420 [Pilobolus umbonatus]